LLAYQDDDPLSDLDLNSLRKSGRYMSHGMPFTLN